MGFDFNPYKHLEVVEGGDGKWHAYCHNCGAEKMGTFSLDTPLSEVEKVVAKHVSDSHKRTRDTFHGWSNY